MSDLLTALGLVLVIEGLLWALAPRFGRHMLEAASEMSEQSLRVAGATAVAAGVIIVWLVRG
jgi:uncharacterized protein YjeT (DUF2065 family)